MKLFAVSAIQSNRPFMERRIVSRIHFKTTSHEYKASVFGGKKFLFYINCCRLPLYLFEWDICNFPNMPSSLKHAQLIVVASVCVDTRTHDATKINWKMFPSFCSFPSQRHRTRFRRQRLAGKTLNKFGCSRTNYKLNYSIEAKQLKWVLGASGNWSYFRAFRKNLFELLCKQYSSNSHWSAATKNLEKLRPFHAHSNYTLHAFKVVGRVKSNDPTRAVCLCNWHCVSLMHTNTIIYPFICLYVWLGNVPTPNAIARFSRAPLANACDRMSGKMRRYLARQFNSISQMSRWFFCLPFCDIVFGLQPFRRLFALISHALSHSRHARTH